MYNFSIPAVLKAYVDHIVRVGITVTPDFDWNNATIVACCCNFRQRFVNDRSERKQVLLAWRLPAIP